MPLAALHEIDKSLGAFNYAGHRVIHLGGRVPQDVEFKVAGRTAVGFLELLRPFLHDIAGDHESGMRILWITPRPKLGANLVSGDFPAASYCVIIITGLEH